MRPTGPEDPNLKALLVALERAARKNKAPVWGVVAERLGGARRKRVRVNLYEISRNAGGAKQVVVPGKVLGTGALDKGISIAAWDFSASARAKIAAAKGKALGIAELVEANPAGSGVKILV